MKFTLSRSKGTAPKSGTYTVVGPRGASSSSAVEVVRGSNGATIVLVDKGAAHKALKKAGRSVLSGGDRSFKK